MGKFFITFSVFKGEGGLINFFRYMLLTSYMKNSLIINQFSNMIKNHQKFLKYKKTKNYQKLLQK